mgnify:CR=1 FL=1
MRRTDNKFLKTPSFQGQLEVRCNKRSAWRQRPRHNKPPTGAGTLPRKTRPIANGSTLPRHRKRPPELGRGMYEGSIGHCRDTEYPGHPGPQRSCSPNRSKRPIAMPPVLRRCQ